VDQLARANGMAPDRVSEIRDALARAERLAGTERRNALTAMAARLNDDAQGAADSAKVRMLAAAVADLAHATR
jgi:hypothetical protein